LEFQTYRRRLSVCKTAEVRGHASDFREFEQGTVSFFATSSPSRGNSQAKGSYSLTKHGFQEWRQRYQRAQGRHRGQKRSDGNGSIWLNYSPTDTGDAAADEAFNNAALDEEP
jgi:hypothetical protein